jgi:hypothetical protein
MNSYINFDGYDISFFEKMDIDCPVMFSPNLSKFSFFDAIFISYIF